MPKSNFLDLLYSKRRSQEEFSFDNLMPPGPLSNYLSPYDVMALYEIATSTSLAAKISEKYKMIDDIMRNRGFKKYAAGTNRVVYSFLEDRSFVVKVAIDKVGLRDNPAEYMNQFLIKPFVTKVLEVTPCGTVGMFERVYPITNLQEYMDVAEDVFDLLVNKIIGKYVIDDIGTDYFMNIGVRSGTCVVLLDFPYIFELDGNKLYCSKKDMETGIECGGVIDYDAGFNNLICSKCGKKYIAKELEKQRVQNLIAVKGERLMIVSIIRNGVKVTPVMESDVIQKPARAAKPECKTTLKVRSNFDALKHIEVPTVEEDEAETEEQEEVIVETKPVEEGEVDESAEEQSVDEDEADETVDAEPAEEDEVEEAAEEQPERLFDSSLIKDEDRRNSGKAVIRSRFIPEPVVEEIDYEDDEEFRGSDPMNRKRNMSKKNYKKERAKPGVLSKY